MISVKSLKQVSLGAALMISLSACALSKQNTGTFISVPEEQGRISVSATVFDGVTPQRIGFADFSEREEYALYRSPSGQSEMVFLETRREHGRNIVLEFNKKTSDTVPMWRFNQGRTISYGPSEHIRTDLGGFWVQPFQQTDTGRQCTGFFGSWDVRQGDPDLRPTKILFGYHCNTAGTAMSVEDAKAFVRGIDIRGVSIPLRVKTAYDLKDGDAPLPPREQQVASLVIAQDGQAGGISGLPHFPLLVSRYYNEHDGIRNND
jgi:hypothetical protein